MIIQQSFKNEKKTLYIIPTPIGNLEDLTFRAFNIMKNELDLLLCEDTRKTGILLKYYDLKLKMISYHEHNKDIMENKIENLFQLHDKIGLVSDAGMPGISDPGYELISFCQNNDINIVVLPGSSAFLLGAVRSNFKNDEFVYSGFLKGSNNEKKLKIEEIMNRNYITIIYESTHKLLKTLNIINDIDTSYRLCIGRELTKLNEEYVIGTALELIKFYEENTSKGEFIIVFDCNNNITSSLTIEEEFEDLINQGLTKKEVIKRIAKSRGLPKNEVYMQFLGE